MPDFTHVNWLAVVIAAVASLVIGWVWYMPAVFGKAAAAASGQQIPTGPYPLSTWVLGIGAAFVMAYVLGLAFGGIGLVNGAVWGALIWLGFVATIFIYSVLAENRSWNYWALNVGYWLVVLVAMGAIVGYFPATM